MSSEDLESLIVSDESLLDPSVDTSRLRRTTDTRQELLGDLQPGLQYDPTLQSTYSDLLRYFSGDLDIAPVSTVTTPTVGSPTDEGGGGGGTIGTGSGGQETESEGIAGFDPGVTPGPSGFIGLDPDMDVSPFEFDDAQTYEPTATSPTTQPIDPSGMLPQISTTLQDLGTPTAIDPSSMLPQISTTQPIDPSGMLPQISETQQESALSEAFRKGKEALDSGVQTISQVGQSIADSVQGTYNDLNKTINVPGLGDIDVGKTLSGLAINTLVGAPVSFVKAAIDQIPKSASQLEYEGYTASQKAAVDEAFGPGGSMEGYNAVSQFGTGPAQSIKDRINNIKNRKAPQTDASKQKINDLEQDLGKITGGLGNIFSAPTNEGQSPKGSTTAGAVGLNTITGPNIDEEEGRPDDPGGSAVDFSAARTADNIAAATETLAGEYDAAVARGERTADSTITSAVNKAKAQIGMPQMLGDVGGSMDRGSTSSPGFSAPSQQGQSPRGSTTGGGGDSNGGGKIVCTMMNESYGFGSFRNKIWLRHSKDLAPEYQKGYHKIFLPLVRLSKTNKFLKKTLEHIAIHRTIDIRQESRGKVHLLGRVYRKILEPICYWVGKHG